MFNLKETKIRMDKILKIIEKYSYNKELVQNAKPESRIIADLKINSTRIVDIILDIEEEYDIMIDDEVIPGLITIEDLMKVIDEK
ncbi:MAG: acyl carrier protein [Marinilabiliales bacterium]|nr:MAG: acyl carrier protein [Marinilabiliales bacterium]